VSLCAQALHASQAPNTHVITATHCGHPVVSITLDTRHLGQGLGGMPVLRVESPAFQPTIKQSQPRTYQGGADADVDVWQGTLGLCGG
jgi:hypothetical protein